VFPTRDLVQESYVDKPFQHQIAWHTKIKPEMSKTFPLVNLPYIKDQIEDSEVKVAGEWPCLQYLAEKYNFLGTNMSEKARIVSFCDVLKDFRVSYMPVAWTSQQGSAQALKAKKEIIPRYLSRMEEETRSNARHFLVNDEISLADIVFFDEISSLLKWWASALSEFPELERVYKILNQNKALSYQKLEEYKMPLTTQYSDRRNELTETEKLVFEENGNFGLSFFERQVPVLVSWLLYVGRLLLHGG
jgi:glutathione S-transferase